MKKLFYVFMSTILLISVTLSAGAALLSPGMLILSAEDPMVMSGLVGEPLAFSENDFTLHTGLSSYDGIKITALPDSAEGTLSISGEAINENTSISKEQLDKLIFTPAEGVTESVFSFSVGDSYTSECIVKLSDEFNYAPTAISALTAVETFSGLSVSGHMVAHDPEGDSLIYEIAEHPRKGSLSYDKHSGSFTYTAASTGRDSFTFIVKDPYGNYSDEAGIVLSVSSNNTGISFCDMEGNGAYTAAVHMIKDDVMSVSEKEGNVYFEPSSTVSRLDFLVSAMNILGADNLPVVSSTGFADDDEIPVDKKGYVYSAYKLGIINGTKNADGEKYFHPSSAITRAEAAVILNNIIGYTTSASFNFEDSVPAWAEESVSAMYELGVLSPEDGYVNSSAPLTKDDTALILHRLNRLVF